MICEKIIICDDDQGNLDVLELILDSEGYIVIKEKSSEKLINTLKKNCPTILLVDLVMPLISGDQLIRMIRADSTLKEIIIIAFSASIHGEPIAIEAGADFYITKPYNIDDITTMISEALK